MQLGTVFAVAMALATVACAQVAGAPTKDIRYVGVVERDANGRIARSSAVAAAFRHQWPCPATGQEEGACPGWYVDHVIPLACGGADAVYNLQWLPASLKIAPDGKDGFERRVYGGNGMSKGCP
jgi:hypothetical protein